MNQKNHFNYINDNNNNNNEKFKIECLTYEDVKIDIDEKDKVELLFTATKHRKIDIIKFLLEYCNVNVNIKQSGKTVLHLACENNNKELVKFLISNNADINLSTDEGKTPLYIACEKDNKYIVKYIIKKCNSNRNEKY